MTVGSN